MSRPSIIVTNLHTGAPEAMDGGISFSLPSSGHLAVTGPSESGKTQLAKALAGKIYCKGSVSIQYNGVAHPHIEMTDQRHAFKNLSGLESFYYQQRFNSFDATDAPTVLEALQKHATQQEGDEKEKTAHIDKVLAALDISYLHNAPLIQLSSGEHKRFQIARALVNPPHLLILDTPYTGLDAQAVKKLDGLLGEMAQKGTQVILIPGTFAIPSFITHVAYLDKGKLLFFGTADQFAGQKDLQPEMPEKQVFFNSDFLPQTEVAIPSGKVAEMRNVSLSYGDHTILKNLSWTIQQGDKWLLKGRNGVGKSSLLNMITGDHPQAYSNEIYLFGKRRGTGESIWDIKKQTGYISPELHAFFDKNISCAQAIASGYFDTMGLYKPLTEAQHQHILQWLDFLQLSHVSNKPLQSVSSGLQRMVLLARALVKNPPLLVLDEPCQGLDREQSNRFVALIDHICSNPSRTLIYVSHDETNIPACVRTVLHLEPGNYKIYSLTKQVHPSLAVA